MRARCEEIAEDRNVAEFFYPSAQQAVDSREQVHSHRASEEGPGVPGLRPRYRDFEAEEKYKTAAQEEHTREFLRSNSATAARIGTPPPPPAPPPPVGPPPPNYPPPKEMMKTQFYGLKEDTPITHDGNQMGFRHVERNSAM